MAAVISTGYRLRRYRQCERKQPCQNIRFGDRFTIYSLIKKIAGAIVRNVVSIIQHYLARIRHPGELAYPAFVWWWKAGRLLHLFEVIILKF